MTTTEIDLFEVPEQLSYEDLVGLWTRVDVALPWFRGDIAIRAKSRMQDLAKDVGVSYKTLLAYRQVAEAYPPDSRRLEVSWSVHQALASLDDHVAVVASRGDWTLVAAREFVRSRSAPPALDSPAPEPTPSPFNLDVESPFKKPEPPEPDKVIKPTAVQSPGEGMKSFGRHEALAAAYGKLTDNEKQAFLRVICLPGGTVSVARRIDQLRSDLLTAREETRVAKDQAKADRRGLNDDSVFDEMGDLLSRDLPGSGLVSRGTDT